MPKTVISEGKTTNEAIENGLKKLGVQKNQVDIKILESDEKKSFFSILAPRVVKVELTIKEEFENRDTVIHREKRVFEQQELDRAESNVKEFLDKFLANVDNNIVYNISKSENGLEVNISSSEASFLIGYRGETLYAMQNILMAIASKDLTNRMRVILDIANYKDKRVKILEDLAEKVARTVIKTGKPVTLEPMKAYERKIIHTKLQNSNRVTTKSIGEEPKRRLVISVKN